MKSLPAMIDGRERVYPFHKTGPFSYHTASLSEGLEQCLFLMVRVCCAKPNSIIMIDEPDAHVFPTAQKSLIEFCYRKIESFRQSNSFCQILITTHSPDILQAVKLENIRQIFLKSDSYKPAEIKSLACIDQLYNVLTEVGAYFFNSWRISSFGCSSETIILRR
jgi:predicted ATPase